MQKRYRIEQGIRQEPAGIAWCTTNSPTLPGLH